MIVLVGSRRDPVTQRLLERWPGRAALLEPVDLSTSGWRDELGAAAADRRAVVGGRVVAVDSVAGVVTRRPAVLPAELTHIVPSDRTYVAAEMTAFLRAWLASLPCAVVNPPSAVALAGPGWRRERWLYEARALGLPALAAVRSTDREREPRPCPTVRVTVVGDRYFGDAELAERARLLADAAGVTALTLDFARDLDDRQLLGANPWPDISEPDLADAVLDALTCAA